MNLKKAALYNTIVFVIIIVIILPIHYFIFPDLVWIKYLVKIITIVWASIYFFLIIQIYKFQTRVKDFVDTCFGYEIANDKIERNYRFLEEALELVQALNCTKTEAHQLVDYVFDREIGEVKQECGGVMVTLAALCLANKIDMAVCGERELRRVWTKVDSIREKQKRKPKHSPLPQ